MLIELWAHTKTLKNTGQPILHSLHIALNLLILQKMNTFRNKFVKNTSSPNRIDNRKYCGDLALYVMAEQAHSKRFHAMLFQLSDVFIKFMGENTPRRNRHQHPNPQRRLQIQLEKTKYTVTEKGEIKFSENQKP
ncbi:MAG: hypothetical protein ACTSV0_03150 [Candidatus Freyarchaeota archaeon]